MAGSDSEVIAASLVDGEVFLAIFERHFSSIHGYLRRRLSRDPAEDLAADVFATAFARRASFDLARPDALPWLYGIATNLLRNHLRLEERELRVLAEAKMESLAVDRGPLGALLGSSLEPVLAQALLALSPQDRDVLLLFAWGELGYEEISVALGLPVGTIKSRLNRARSHVRDALLAAAQTREASHG
jgi:RNA polymerase sigma factor (sigma-70 family)